MQVAVVEIKTNGQDQAVYVAGAQILAADPGCGDSVESIEVVAISLSQFFGVEIEHIQYAPEEDWQWDDVRDALVKNRQLQTKMVYDDSMTDWSIQAATSPDEAVDYVSRLNYEQCLAVASSSGNSLGIYSELAKTKSIDVRLALCRNHDVPNQVLEFIQKQNDNYTVRIAAEMALEERNSAM